MHTGVSLLCGVVTRIGVTGYLCSMSPKISQFWEGYVCALSDMKMSHSVITKTCMDKGLQVSKRSIGNIIKRNKNLAPAEKGTATTGIRKRKQPSRPRATVARVTKMARRENPPTQRAMASMLGTSQRTVGRIIHQNLGLRRVHKARGHRLTARHISERFTNARKLYEGFLAGDRWKNVFTLDEAWLYLSNTNQPRAICYRHKDDKGRADFVRECKESFSKGFMVVAGYSDRGRQPLVRVPGKTKVNSAYFQQYVMDPLYDQHIPRLYGNDSSNVVIHMDKASSHTSRSSCQYYDRKKRECGIGVIPFDSIPVKSPDASPLDYCGFGLLKYGLAKRRPRTVQGLWKAANEVWDSIPQAVLSRSLLQWKLRCRAIVACHGRHIEHNRWWRKGIP